MDLYNRINNIYVKNNEEELKKAILNVKQILSGLVEERTCKIYSSFLVEELKKQHVPVRLINTLDLGLEYEHVFVLVPSNYTGYFLVDLTFSQFNSKSEELINLLTNGYQLVDNGILNDYFNIVSKGNCNKNISLDNMFYFNQSVSQNSGYIKR